MRDLHDKRLNPMQSFIIAGVAGAGSRAAVNALGVTKSMSAVGVPGGRQGCTGALRWLLKTEGLKGLFLGEKISAIRAFAHYGVMFTSYNQLSQLLVDKPDGMLSYYSIAGSFVAGSMSSVMATLLTHPLDVAKTRVFVAPFAGHAKHYAGGEMAVLGQILAEEGLYRGIYRGLGPGLVGAGAFGGVLFAALEIADNVPWLRRGVPFLPSGTMEQVYYYTMAATAACAAAHPFDVIRHKYMAQSKVLPNGGGVDIKFANLQQCFVNIYKANGVFGYYAGFYSTVWRAFPQVAIFTAIYATMKSTAGLPTLPHVMNKA